MKKIIFSMFLSLCLVYTATAQLGEGQTDPDVTNKRGAYILPVQGDFALGFDALPVMSFFTSPVEFEQYTIIGKYFLENDRALRVSLGIGVNSETNKDLVSPNPAPTPSDPTKDQRVIDVSRESETFLGLSVGYELRRGQGRVQGFYGGEFGLAVYSRSEKNEWGNNLSATNTNSFNPRLLERSYGTAFSVGLGGFVGAEYFIAPKLSIGAEMSLGFYFTTWGEGEENLESWNGTAISKRTQRVDGGGSAFDIETRPGASIFFTFHF